MPVRGSVAQSQFYTERAREGLRCGEHAEFGGVSSRRPALLAETQLCPVGRRVPSKAPDRTAHITGRISR